ncbi:MAG: TMEM175 family protein [Burkholderiales bacterium]
MSDDGAAGASASGVFTKGRLEALTDGIMAVAMTILVLDLKFDATEAIATDTHLLQHLVDLERTFTVYLVSFVVLGMCWIGHHHQFHYVRRTDRGLMWINFAFMMLVTVVPFTTSLMIDYEDLRLPCVLFGAVQLLLSLTLLANLGYVARRPALRDEALTAEVAASIRRRLLLLSAVPAVSMAVALVNTRAALYLYALTVVVQFLQKPLAAAGPGGAERAR